MKGTAVRVVARGPAGTVGALVDRTLIPIMSKAMTRMTGLVITRMGGWKGDLRVTSGPPRLYSLEDTFFIRHQGGGRGGDVGGRCTSGKSGDEGGGGVGGVTA